MSSLCAFDRILVLGARGTLGRAWQAAFANDPRFRFMDLDECDICNEAQIASFIDGPDQLVVNCAAYTDVDAAETNANLALRVNGEAPGLLAGRCGRVGATLLHFSTDYVFDGERSEPYPTRHERRPVNVYGASKALGEERVERSGADHLLLRTSWLFAPWGKNFLTRIAHLAGQRERISVVNDQRGRPTLAQDLVEGAVKLIDAGKRGTLHICNDGDCTWFEFARRIAGRVNPACVVEPCAAVDYPRPARRPKYSVLDLTTTIDTIGAPPTWEDALDRALALSGAGAAGARA